MLKSLDNSTETGTGVQPAPAPNQQPKQEVDVGPAKSIKSPAFQFYPKDFLSDELQMLLSLPEAGAYIRLLCHCWLSGSLPDDTTALARLCGATPAHMSKMWPSISRCFQTRPDGRWMHKRLEKIRRLQDEFRKKQKEKADKRWHAHGNATALPALGNAFLADRRSQIADSRSLEKEKGDPPDFDVWFHALVALYPKRSVTSGPLTHQAFMAELEKFPGGPVAGWALMQANLDNQKAGSQWLKGMIPKLQNWLADGAWQQQHEVAAVRGGRTGAPAAGKYAHLEDE